MLKKFYKYFKMLIYSLKNMFQLSFGRFVDEEIDSVIEGLPSILEQDNVDIRIATGEALAICYELARNYRGENWEGFDDEDEILYALEDLAKGFFYFLILIFSMKEYF